MQRIVLFGGLIFVFCWFPAVECVAAPITFDFTGTVTSIIVYPNYSPPPPDVFVGAAVLGSYTFESTVTDGSAATNTGMYVSSGSPYGFAVQVGSLSVIDDYVRIFVLSDSYAFPQYNASSEYKMPGYNAGIALLFPTGPVFPTDSLPTAPPDLNSFANRGGNITYYPLAGMGTMQGYRVSFRLDSLTTPIPEPMSLTLVALGIIGIGALRFCRRI